MLEFSIRILEDWMNVLKCLPFLLKAPPFFRGGRMSDKPALIEALWR